MVGTSSAWTGEEQCVCVCMTSSVRTLFSVGSDLLVFTFTVGKSSVRHL